MNTFSSKKNAIILFDGFCNLCDSSVQFVIKRDLKQKFSFCSLQSNEAQSFLERTKPELKEIDSILFIENNKIYTKSSAALKIAKELNAAWPLLYVFFILPKFIRDAVYDFIAKRRYAWYGKKEQCRIPTKEELDRFIC
ncbi:thiol-disulfide oxidoreductase DCC family protein [Flavicella sediminum]|uniref:thiol-disulfide oxidoreductase DCC family protein n=1 Tax=Flavicella sediminum TaxID=2585141 RepID=UPI00111F164A|nr:thiol-disulfide oxidoreductase DCC family protein [Flavicella sediminum]